MLAELQGLLATALQLFSLSHFSSSLHHPNFPIMASATGIPQDHPDTIPQDDEPLLGRPGDVTQRSDENIYRNLFTGKHEKPLPKTHN